MEDRNQFRKDMTAELGVSENGIATAQLHSNARETVTFHALEAQAVLTNSALGGIETLVIEGTLGTGTDTLAKGSWLRLPAGTPLEVVAGAQAACVWTKSGHLPFAEPPAV